MALIRPFNAWRYNDFLAENLADLTAPLSETILQQRQAIFYKQPFHYFHISSPLDVPPFSHAKRRVDNWKLDKVILQDALPAIYVYFQYFHLKETEDICCRKGFIVYLQAEDFDKKIVLPHEKTINKAIEYRTNLLECTQMQSIPTHGFYTDKTKSLEKYLDESMQNPLYEVKDKNDVLHQMSLIQDKKIIHHFIETLQNQQIWIADGHHRYESSVKYRQQQMENNPNHTGEEAYNFHLMWLTNTESSNLGVFPTHRIVHSLEEFNQDEFLEQLSGYFEIEAVRQEKDLGLAPSENLWTFMLIFKGQNYLIRLKPEVFEDKDWHIPQEVKALDVSVMHRFILEKCLGLKEQMQFDFLDFSQYVSRCYEMVENDKANFAILTRKITLAEIEKICQSGQTMPAKATYFYPKVLGGLVFGGVGE